MSNDTVLRLAIVTASACQSQVTTWEELAKAERAQVQILLASTTSFTDTAPQLRKRLEKELGIPSLLFERLYRQLNGFAGHNVQLDREQKVETYTHWSRFTVKQTYENLMPKRTFTPHVSYHQPGLENRSDNRSIHGPQSVLHGWEWYEMGFFVSWKPSGSLTLICFDLPTKSQSNIQSIIESQQIDISNPYSTFLLILDELLRLYDDSVWSIRNHISHWEATERQQKTPIETNYSRLHEIARHSVHVNETLSVAIRSLETMGQHYRDFRANTDLDLGQGKHRRWDSLGSRMSFQRQFLENLLQRSTSNNARIQNEIALAFHEAAQRDSKIQLRIGEEARREASAMKAIAVVTMTFLPATFVSTIFGTNFFSLEPREGAEGVDLAVSGQFWIYWAISVPVTVATLALWLWWNRWARHLPPSRTEV